MLCVYKIDLEKLSYGPQGFTCLFQVVNCVTCVNGVTPNNTCNSVFTDVTQDVRFPLANTRMKGETS